MGPYIAAFVTLLLPASTGCCADAHVPQHAAETMAKAVHYLRSEVAVGGGYLGRYKLDTDLDKIIDQWGEGHATPTQNWTQPPGNPSVGFAFLRAWEATGEQHYVDAAVEVANSLVYGQLAVGGWDYIVDHSPAGEKAWYYRHNADSDDPSLKSGRNTGTYDDNVSQHATRLLIAVDLALEQGDAAIHEAAMAALEYILKSQQPSGGWPQRYPLSGRSYGDFFTYNDNSIADCADVMMIAWRAYEDQRYFDSVAKAGDFIIATQQPEPQPVWAQQYDHDLKPAWARRFEPPSVTAGESRGVMRTLIAIALFTKDDKYVKPLGPALEWYRRSELTGEDKGKWARFYELGTNRPLYFTSGTYLLTYDDSDTPDHYSFKGSGFPTATENQYREITEKGIEQYLKDHEEKPLTREEKLARAKGMEERVRGIVDSQDDRGRWVKGDMIDMATFGTSITTLASYLRLINDR